MATEPLPPPLMWTFAILLAVSLAGNGLAFAILSQDVGEAQKDRAGEHDAASNSSDVDKDTGAELSARVDSEVGATGGEQKASTRTSDWRCSAVDQPTPSIVVTVCQTNERADDRDGDRNLNFHAHTPNDSTGTVTARASDGES